MPTLAYRITEWRKRYEVTQKGHEADDDTPVEELRRRPLEFYRSKVRGHNKGPAYRRMKKKASKFGIGMGSAVFGIFHDLLELAANQPPQFRGWILCEKQNPIEAEDIADLITEDTDVVTRALEILCDPKIGWIQQIEFSVFPDSPEIPGNAGVFRPASEDETETKVKGKEETKAEDSRQSRRIRSVSEPISRGSDFGSDSGTLTKVKVTGILLTCFPTRTASDDTTLRNILDQVPPDRYPRLVDAARESMTGRNPLALFTQRAKRLGFRGNGGP